MVFNTQIAVELENKSLTFRGECKVQETLYYNRYIVVPKLTEHGILIGLLQADQMMSNEEWSAIFTY